MTDDEFGQLLDAVEAARAKSVSTNGSVWLGRSKLRDRRGVVGGVQRHIAG
jgi:hypothetical protein